MSSFVNPLNRDRSSDLSERAAAINLWVREALALTEQTAVSVNELPCVKPSCPRLRTVILVLSEGAPTREISIRKPLADVSNIDVLDACLDLLRDAPS